MSFQAKPLADGVLPIVQGAIYAVPIGVAASYIKQLLLFNENAATQTIDLYLTTLSGTPRRWARVILEQNQRAVMLEHGETITLEAQQSIEAVTTTAAAVSYTITGVEET